MFMPGFFGMFNGFGFNFNLGGGGGGGGLNGRPVNRMNHFLFIFSIFIMLL